MPTTPCLSHHFSLHIHRDCFLCFLHSLSLLSHSQLKIAPTSAIVVESGNKDDPTAVCKENTLKVIRTDARKFYTAPEIRFALTRTGIKVRGCVSPSFLCFNPRKFVSERPEPCVEFTRRLYLFSTVAIFPTPLPFPFRSFLIRSVPLSQ